MLENIERYVYNPYMMAHAQYIYGDTFSQYIWIYTSYIDVYRYIYIIYKVHIYIEYIKYIYIYIEYI